GPCIRYFARYGTCSSRHCGGARSTTCGARATADSEGPVRRGVGSAQRCSACSSDRLGAHSGHVVAPQKTGAAGGVSYLRLCWCRRLVVRINVNGSEREIEAPGDMPLLWVLRDLLHLTGTKFGCGMAQCGACTVHLDGRPVRSCITPASAVSSVRITTIEGLSQHGDHPVQRAWKELDVVQCGYCQSGQIMSAAALIRQKPTPTDADIDAAMSGNLCRCGTYQRIRAAVQLAARLAISTDRGS